ncbi:hypothetical protein ACFLRY_05470 [Bacteroidota bacterium]
MRLKELLFLFFILLFINVFSQDEHKWWNKKHNWDGSTNWSYYMIISPGYMGPNALPVPEIHTGLIYPESFIEMGGDAHYSQGDKTVNMFSRLQYVIPSKVFAFEVYIVPIEYYEMDTATRDERFARNYDAKGIAGGDFYFSSMIQILKSKINWPDILMNISFKTPSGTNLDDARYTDAMAFYFDFSFGKTFKTKGKLSIRPYLLAGFYSWQTNRTDNRQDDALMLGGGFDISIGRFTFTNSAGGYSGYLNIKDEPLVYRFKTLYEKRDWNFLFQFQQGLHDFEYSSIRLGVQWKFSKVLEKIIN